MKRIVGLLLGLALVLSLFACGRTTDSTVVDGIVSAVENSVSEASDNDPQGKRSNPLGALPEGQSSEIEQALASSSEENNSEENNYETIDDSQTEGNDNIIVYGENENADSQTEEEINQTDESDVTNGSVDTASSVESSEESSQNPAGKIEEFPSQNPTESLTDPQNGIDSFLLKSGRVYLIVSLIIIAFLIAAIIYLLSARRKDAAKLSELRKNSRNNRQYLDDLTPQTDDILRVTTDSPANVPIRSVSVHNIGGRKNQEDSFGVSDLNDAAQYRSKGVMAVVADGMGGLKGGENVSSLAVLSMLQGFSESGFISDPESELNRLLNNTVAKVNEYLTSTVGLKKSGTTLMAVVVFEGKLSWVSVGDSRTALFRNGKLTDLNRRHNYAEELAEMVRENKITSAQALNHPDREKLTSYIGMGNLKYVDRSTRPMLLIKGDKIILMSDGVFNTLTDPEIEQILSLPTESIGAQLESRILQKANAHQDNFTAVVLEYMG